MPFATDLPLDLGEKPVGLPLQSSSFPERGREYFENSFLAPLYADIKQNFRDEAEKQAAITGDW